MSTSKACTHVAKVQDPTLTGIGVNTGDRFSEINQWVGYYVDRSVWVCVGLVFCLVIYNKKKWILGLFCTPLIHFSFLFVVPIIVLFYTFKHLFNSNSKLSSLLYYIFVFTFLLSFVMDTNVIKLDILSDATPLQAPMRIIPCSVRLH